MAEFSYKAINAGHAIIKGDIAAANEQEVLDKLCAQGLVPLSIQQANYFSLKQLWQARHNVNQTQIVLFTQQLATMLNAGLPIEKALELLSKMMHHPAMKEHIDYILAQVRDGVSFSAALESRSHLVPTLYISMVRAGETGGTLASTLQSLSDYLSGAQDLQRHIISALIYPAILLLMAIASVMALLTFVVPSFEPMFAELGGEMPAITQIVIGSGAFIESYWWLLLTLTTVGLMVIRYQLSQADKRQYFHRRLIQSKKLGDLLVKIETARFARTLSALIYNGVPILRGLSLSAEVMQNTAFIAAIKEAANEVKTGKSMAEALSAIPFFPAMALQMLVVGEETGEMSSMLLKIADTYDKEVKVTMERLLNLLVPMMILLLSALIATIVISILLAILSVNDLFG